MALGSLLSSVPRGLLLLQLLLHFAKYVPAAHDLDNFSGSEHLSASGISGVSCVTFSVIFMFYCHCCGCCCCSWNLSSCALIKFCLPSFLCVMTDSQSKTKLESCHGLDASRRQSQVTSRKSPVACDVTHSLNGGPNRLRLWLTLKFMARHTHTRTHSSVTVTHTHT